MDRKRFRKTTLTMMDVCIEYPFLLINCRGLSNRETRCQQLRLATTEQLALFAHPFIVSSYDVSHHIPSSRNLFRLRIEISIILFLCFSNSPTAMEKIVLIE